MRRILIIGGCTIVACCLIAGLFLASWLLPLIRPPLAMEDVRPGMTIEQVEAICGKPASILPPRYRPHVETRAYSNDGVHYLMIEFKDGRVIERSEETHERRLFKVG
jgi:hypothetical protein